MSITESVRRIVAPATVPTAQPAPSPKPPKTGKKPQRTPRDSRFSRVRDYLFGVGDDRVDLTTVQSHALRNLSQR